MARLLTEKEQRFLVALFKSFKEQRVIAIILRNYDAFPEKIGNDLDIFIPRKQHNDARKILLEVLSKYNGCLMHIYRKDSFAALWMQLDNDKPIHLDFYHGAYFWRGRQYLCNEDLIANARCLERYGIYIPSKAHEAVVLYVTSLIWGGFYKNRYTPQIRILLDKRGDREKFQLFMTSTFGKGSMPSCLFNSQEFDKLEQLHIYNLMRKKLKLRWLKELCRFNISESYTVLRYWLWEIWCLFKPAGIWGLATNSGHADIAELKKYYGDENVYFVSALSTFQLIKLRICNVQRMRAKNSLVIVSGSEEILKKAGRKFWFNPMFTLYDGETNYSNRLKPLVKSK